MLKWKKLKVIDEDTLNYLLDVLKYKKWIINDEAFAEQPNIYSRTFEEIRK